MTSHRNARCALLAIVFTCVAGLLGGCASLPDDAAVVEQLDPETGLTVLRLGHPLELYREVYRQERADRFGFIAPFETNQMGKREVFLWVAVPAEGTGASTTPTVSVDGARLELGPAGNAPDFAGLRSSPYKIPTPWIATFYFRVDSDTASRLGTAHALSVNVPGDPGEGTPDAQYTAQVGDDPRLREFAARH